ncbi:MAG: ferredoxin--NADP reductase [Planctomycetes bacterium]|nr:ferredoxin--NADP reductase [Planctomycetota bacterium]
MSEQDPNATLVERRDVTESLAYFLVAPDKAPFASFEPGQFTNLGLEVFDRTVGERRFVRRAYSMGSPPTQRARLEFYVRRVQGGLLTEALFELRSGARLWLDAAVYGRFTLEPVPADRDVVFVASGTGVAPYVSMLRAYSGRRRWRRAVLVETVREERELGYRAEIEAFATHDPSFVWLPTVTRAPETSPWRGARVRVPTLLDPEAFARRTGVALDPSTTHVLLCGNPTMLADVSTRLGELGFVPHSRRAPGQVHTERYW